MDDGDAAALEGLFAAEATLRHLTGTVQPLPEWLAGIRARI
ncbi:MAG: hypothetical protein M9891_06275 [Austwickia sp.]|nr:hypothetical protein [Austwickia sp.]